MGKKTTVECKKYPKQKDPDSISAVNNNSNNSTAAGGASQDLVIEVLNVEHLKYVFAFYAVGIVTSTAAFLAEVISPLAGQGKKV